MAVFRFYGPGVLLFRRGFLSPNADNTARVYIRVHQCNLVGPSRCNEEEWRLSWGSATMP